MTARRRKSTNPNGAQRLISEYNLANLQLEDSPLAQYLMADTAGTVMTDSTGNARHGTYGTGVTLGSAEIAPGQGASVTCGSAGVGTVASASWMNSTYLTMEALVYATSLTTYHGIGGRDAGSSNRQSQWRYNVATPNGHVWNNSSTLQTITTGTSLSASTPTLVALTFDGTDIKMWHNGSQVGTAALSGTLKSATATLGIGQADGMGNFPFVGRMSHFAYYGTALSSDRLLAHAKAAGLA